LTASSAHDLEILARLRAAERISRLAGDAATGFFETRADLQISHKAAQDRVSEADRAVETLIRSAVAAEFPGDAFLGEEHGAATGSSPYLWVVDPIDGTTPFLSGLADWCVSIAIAVAGEPVIGVVHAPRHRETFVAARGHGATVNGRPLAFDPARKLGDGMFAFGGSLRCNADDTGRFVTRLMQAGGVAFHNGSGALMLAYVADGRLVGYYDEHIKAWDCFAGIVLVEEAGGRARFGAADRVERGGPLLAGTPASFEEGRSLLEPANVAARIG
jgi:myo-inositol-1(or 4)-monophosphatase